jgi:hypothetical protein
MKRSEPKRAKYSSKEYKNAGGVVYPGWCFCIYGTGYSGWIHELIKLIKVVKINDYVFKVKLYRHAIVVGVSNEGTNPKLIAFEF